MNKYESQLTLELEKSENFDTPEGIYRVAVKNVFELPEPYKDETDTSIRIKWRILEPSSPFFEYVVGKRYPRSLKQHSSLWKDLTAWLGTEGMQCLIQDGQLSLDRLKDLEADVEVAHIDNGQKKPYVFVRRIGPPGALTGQSPVRKTVWNSSPATSSASASAAR